MINPIAEHLGLDTKTDVYANNILFNEKGDYAGYDDTEPTSRAGGKPKVVRMLKEQKGYKTVVMIGDGATDMEANVVADAFIGYGGVSVRPAVEKDAHWYVKDFKDLTSALKSDPDAMMQQEQKQASMATEKREES